MAFIPPTIEDIEYCSKVLSVSPSSTDAPRAIARQYAALSNQEYRISNDEFDDLTDTIEYLLNSTPSLTQ
ncbi:TPA: c1 repressor inactivator [Escherichia coli]|nr:c1 repressor inactivator [Escherichia coli]HCO9282390.1 c1 repressor inactivator [Escherichia coli]